MRHTSEHRPDEKWPAQERRSFVCAILLTIVWVGVLLAGSSCVVDFFRAE